MSNEIEEYVNKIRTSVSTWKTEPLPISKQLPMSCIEERIEPLINELLNVILELNKKIKDK
jgi:hypothetical protein